MMNQDVKPKRRPYQKPDISRVPLRPDEAVLGSCKTSGVGGPVSSDCFLSSCAEPGS